MKNSLLFLLLAFGASVEAAELPTYTLGTPMPATINCTTEVSENAWLASNAVFVATAGFATKDGISRKVVAENVHYALMEAEVGFSWERSKPEYYLSDRLEAPKDVDWNATYVHYQTLQAKGEEMGFLFNPNKLDPCVYAISGGNQSFEWIYQDGTTNKMTYVIAMSYKGRPRRIYWTDSPFNGPTISLAGKFVKFMGNDELLTLRYATQTNVVGGVSQEMANKVVSGLYVDPQAQVLYAAGQLSGQCVMVYYDTGSYENILAVQVVEVRKPEAIELKGTIGEALKPDGQGYNVEGLTARVSTGISDSTDNRGDYLYQHRGNYSYSKKNGDVFPLRPTVDARWLASVYWMETDAMGVQWPFEYDQYENDWPKNGQIYVRGRAVGADGAVDYGAKIYIAPAYSATLEKYQEPEGHALAVGGDNSFYTTDAGWSLLRLTANDNIWFLPVHSVLRTDTNYYTLAVSPVTVGRELSLRAGSRSGVAGGKFFYADADEPGYIYKAVSGTQYDVNLYHEKTSSSTNETSASSSTNLASAVYAIGTGPKPIEIWWSERVDLGDDAPAPITVPTLPQVYKPVWPEDDEMPQIVIASQQGSANESVYQQNGAAYFDSPAAYLELSGRRYFPSGEGTLSFWTRPMVHSGTLLATPNAPSALIALGQDWDDDDGGDYDGADRHAALEIAIEDDEMLVVRSGDETVFSVPMPPLATVNDWTHIALAFDASGARLMVDAVCVAESTSPELALTLSDYLDHNALGFNIWGDWTPVAVGREVAEVIMRSRALSADEIKSARYELLSGAEANVTGYYTFRKGVDLKSGFQSSEFEFSSCVERVHGETCEGFDVIYVEPGAPARGTGVIVSDTVPSIYYQNDAGKPGYNPNEEHAFVRSGSGGYVTWALRTDLNTTNTPPPAAFVEYGENGRARLQMFSVVLTNDTWRILGADCTAGKLLPGPHPLDLFDNPWLPEDTWDPAPGGKPGAAYRDRKGQIWARGAGELKMRMYYAMQDGFAFPQLSASQMPKVGDPIPWLALLDQAIGQNMDPRQAEPAAWTWTVKWPEATPEMRIGQTLTRAADGLPEVWGAKSMAVIYPDPSEVEKTVLLSDPTVIQSVPFEFKNLATLGLTTDKNGGLTTRGGKYYFTELPPHLSSRLYLDGTNNKLCFQGEMKTSTAGASILYPNVLSSQERSKVKALVSTDMAKSQPETYKLWEAAVAKLATTAVRPNVSTNVNAEIFTLYSPVDHYALAAMGGTNYVTIIENDATNAVVGVATNVTPVAEGDPINMHVIKVIPEYYTGRIVTREDEVNLLSQQLSVLYTESFLGEADDYVFEWRSARPNMDGTVPSAYDNTGVFARKYDPDRSPEGIGNVRLTIGEQGDTLANMVNTYWICRYRAATPNAPSYAVMGDRWSEWCAPPALAEGWVQRVLNNITPFNQRMTDLYNNAVETPISMIQLAGKPYTGDVALNQDNMTSVGLIELYETILNKAESLSLQLGINDTDANKQLLLAVERLQDLYALLGDEAYSDAKNPTIGVGTNKAYGEDNTPEIEMASLSSALFCFDNQVATLLDEELALLRGRTGESAPVATQAPYYNRLVWNFTKGITAGEVAYAVNYNIEGTEKVVLGEEQASRLYPQGHGDAYGHYLSALKGWYRLIRNPNFTWPVAQGEMVVADSTVNVDYYEEAKFAEAAAKVAKTAADCVDLTARKACRDNGGNAGTGYLDEKTERAFGYGEWAARGGYGALVNWVAANSLLPVDATTLDKDAFDEVFKDGALTRIDRGTVGELAEICESAAKVQRKLDELDAGMNPLGLSDAAIPFDITPIGVDDGSATHYEQIRERAGTALSNARKVLERAQEYSNRLRLLQESNDSYENAIVAQEAAFNKELIGYYGTPYSDDIGPGKTYVQGYDGPDLIHYMWMDLSKFGITSVADTQSYQIHYYTGLAGMQHWYNVFTALGNQLSRTVEDAEQTTEIMFETSANGLVVKPKSITGRRLTQGSIQEKYAEFLAAYAEVQACKRVYNAAVTKLDHELSYNTMMSWLYFSNAGLKQGLAIYKQFCDYADASVNISLNSLEWAQKVSFVTEDTFLRSVPQIAGAGMTINTDPRAMANTATSFAEATTQVSLESSKLLLKNSLITSSIPGIMLNYLLDEIGYWTEYYEDIKGITSELQEKAGDVTAAHNDLQQALIRLNQAVEAYNTEVANGETCLAEREAARKVQANMIAQARYNDMFFRLQRNATLSRYSQSFDLAQKYTFYAAQAYDYETALLSSDAAAGDVFKAKIIGARSLGAFDADGEPMLGDAGDTGLAGILAQMDANWRVLKPRLGINNPQNYATWFSLRRECFRILPGEEGDEAWAKELTKHWVDDIQSNPDFIRHCQPFLSQFGLRDKEPGLIIPFETTIDFAKNLFGRDLAGGDSSYDSTWYATRIAAAGLWFDGYNGKEEGYKGNALLANTPVAYLVPIGKDCMRVPGVEEGTIMQFSVQDQVVPAPFAIGSTHLDDAKWVPSMLDGDYAGADSAAKIRRHPSFRAYFDATGENGPDDDKLDATRLIGRSVWNTKWLLVIPGGGMNADREKALSVFINGSDVNRDGQRDLTPVSDIRIGFKTYSHSGN
ncbi:MAG: LamG domain-containing protein [Kiritimatiellae bacterium]|nr:LamG domain-containing protein [Kiritimatiellia bacterium]